MTHFFVAKAGLEVAVMLPWDLSSDVILAQAVQIHLGWGEEPRGGGMTAIVRSSRPRTRLQTTQVRCNEVEVYVQ